MPPRWRSLSQTIATDDHIRGIHGSPGSEQPGIQAQQGRVLAVEPALRYGVPAYGELDIKGQRGADIQPGEVGNLAHQRRARQEIGEFRVVERAETHPEGALNVEDLLT